MDAAPDHENHTVDPDDRSEVLDSDKLGTPDDTSIESHYPAEELFGADDYGITAAEEQVGEPLEERVLRENPDVHPEDDLASPTWFGSGDGDEERDGDEVGRLVEPGVDDELTVVDDEAEAIAYAVDQDDLSAEEAAVRLTEDPPMGTLDGDYL